MVRLLLVALLAVLLLGCESATEKQAKAEAAQAKVAQAKAKAEAEQKVRAEQEAKAKAEAEKTAQKKKATVDSLLKKFVKTKDKFDGSVSYRHKSYGYYDNANGTTIRCSIDNGTFFAHSVFVNGDWIFHESFLVKAGEVSEEFSGKEQREVVNGIVEDVYLNSHDSESLAKLVSSASPNKPVMVRLLGKYRHDYNLRAAHRQAIKDTWDLYKALYQ